jgi:hypothetical protein
MSDVHRHRPELFEDGDGLEDAAPELGPPEEWVAGGVEPEGGLVYPTGRRPLEEEILRVAGQAELESPERCPMCGRTGGCRCDELFEEGWERHGA